MNGSKLFVATFIVSLGIVWADIVPQLSIKTLVSQADLIIVGKIERVEQIGQGFLQLQSSAYTRRDFQATISVDETIKGESTSSLFVFNYSTPAVDSYGNVAGGELFPGTYQVVFLKKTTTGFAFVSPYSPSLPANSTPCGANWDAQFGEDAYEKVLRRVLDMLCVNSSPEEKQAAVGTLNWEEDASAAPFLKATLNLPDVKDNPTVRTAIVGDLLKWNDLSVLPLAEDDLFQSSKHVDGNLKSNLLLAISSLDPSLSIPVLSRALTLPEPEARIGAARFLEYTHSETALGPLLSALDDPDREVQFAVMQSLGNLTNQHHWRPQTTENTALWSDCLKHWHEFAALRHTQTKPVT